MNGSTLISNRLAEAISEQIGREYLASIQYRMIAAYFAREALPQLATMFERQADEEAAHAAKFLHYVTEAGGVAAIPSIAQGQADFVNVEEAIALALSSELNVTKCINDLMDLAIEERDHLARGLLQWFVDEQLEEVSLMSDLLRVVQRAGDNLNYVEQYVSALPVPPPTA
ncbi:MAG: ferritin [Chloroflexota bacterium]